MAIFNDVGEYTVYEVFTPTREANLNFVERSSINDRLVEALMTPGKQVIVFGETGAGKSSLLERKLREVYEGHVVTRCVASTSFDQILMDAFDQLSVYYTRSLDSEKSFSISPTVEADFKAVKLALEASFSASSSSSSERALPPQLTPQRLAKFLGERDLCWVVEDFHKLADGEKTLFAQVLKMFSDMARDYPRLKIVAVGAAESARQIIELDAETRRRVAEIQVDLMTNEEISQILEQGQQLLNIDFNGIAPAMVGYGIPPADRTLC